MACNHPRHAFKTGRLTDNGKDEYIITDGDVFKLPYEGASKQIGELANKVPREVINGRMFLTDPIEIPCGSCIGCRMAHAKEWAVRCVLERDYFSQDDCYFLTLTYDNAHLPKDRQLCKEDLQKFWKRLRKAGYKFRYFACGEYGETYQRPHFHAIVFGLHLEDLRFYSLSDRKSTLYFSKTIEDAWPLGMSCLGYADIGSIAYTAGYVEKKQNDPNWNKYLVKPFVTMSRKPAIGTLYMLDNKQSILSSNKVYGDFGNSHSHSVPRHFIRKLGDEDEMWLKGRSIVMQKRAEKAKIIEHCVYGISDDFYLGFLKDEEALQRISKIKRS